MIACALVLASPAGCFTYHYVNRSVIPGETHRSWGSFFLWGIIGHQYVDVREYCGQGEIREVNVGTNFFTWLVSSLTLGIYSPRVVVVQCGRGPSPTAFRIELPDEPPPVGQRRYAARAHEVRP